MREGLLGVRDVKASNRIGVLSRFETRCGFEPNRTHPGRRFLPRVEKLRHWAGDGAGRAWSGWNRNAGGTSVARPWSAPASSCSCCSRACPPPPALPLRPPAARCSGRRAASGRERSGSPERTVESSPRARRRRPPRGRGPRAEHRDRGPRSAAASAARSAGGAVQQAAGLPVRRAAAPHPAHGGPPGGHLRGPGPGASGDQRRGGQDGGGARRQPLPGPRPGGQAGPASAAASSWRSFPPAIARDWPRPVRSGAREGCRSAPTCWAGSSPSPASSSTTASTCCSPRPPTTAAQAARRRRPSWSASTASAPSSTRSW